MNSRIPSFRFTSSLGFAGFVALTLGHSGSGHPALLPATPQSEATKTAEQVFKNIQVFKGIPASQLMPTMFFMADSLGVGCDHCHVTAKGAPWPLEKDDKETKRTARKMTLMMRAINQQNFGGELKVNCVNCHNGHAKPSRVSSVGPLPKESTDKDDSGDVAALPTLDQVLDKYVEALGGREAIEGIRSRIMRGTSNNDGKISALEVDLKAPDRFLITTGSGDGAFVRGFDGKAGWNRGLQGIFSLSGEELNQARRSVELHPAVKLKELYPGSRVAGRGRVAGRDTYTVTADGAGMSEKFYFDTELGSLLRRLTLVSTALGQYPCQYDYTDYRELDGVKLPFALKISVPGGSLVYKYSTVEDNVPLADAKFQRPAG